MDEMDRKLSDYEAKYRGQDGEAVDDVELYEYSLSDPGFWEDHVGFSVRDW